MRKLKYRVWNKEKECYFMFDTTIGFAGTEKVWGEIEQYIGLKDKNGKDIYGGDQFMLHGKLITVVYRLCCFYGEHKEPDGIFLAGIVDEIEIIGNIHEETT